MLAKYLADLTHHQLLVYQAQGVFGRVPTYTLPKRE